MKIPFYQIDAFADSVFKGNPAGVCYLDEWPEDAILQSIASENNLSETAFLVKDDSGFHLRWFTPKTEVDLCGHATLASAYVVFNYYEPNLTSMVFKTKSGNMEVTRSGDLISMFFPKRGAEKVQVPDLLIDALGIRPVEVLKSRDYLVVYENEEQIKSINPDLNKLSELECLGVIVTSGGRNSDFVSRFFAPKVGIPEDPVTGSAHCTLIPYWSEKLNRKKLHALQLSERGGELFCEDMDDKVKISGKAVPYLKGEIDVGR